MKLLVITQRVDVQDDNLGFFHNWIEKFSERLDRVYVICLWQGEHHLPQNVSVYSLGKEKGVSKIGQFFRLQKYLIQILPRVEGVFVHMCPIYALASFPLAKIFRKRIMLWYAHARGSFLVKIIEKLVVKILTPSKDSFIYKSKKIIVTGHGINTDLFKPSEIKTVSDKKTILYTGRITPIKDLETLVGALDILVHQKGMKNIKVRLIGSPVDESEKRYAVRLKKFIQEKGLENYTEFFGSVPHREIVKFYQQSDVFIDMIAGGGAGKTPLEAMACGTPVVLCTPTFNDLLGNFKDEIIFEEKNPRDLAEKLLSCLSFSGQKKKDFGCLLRDIVVSHHNLDNLIDKIINNFKKQ